MSPAPGQTVSRYRILRSLGHGGMGMVYLAEDTRLGRQVALKFLNTDALTDDDKTRFMQEARAAAAIRHPNVCPVHDVDEDSGRLFISMDYLEGETLASRIRQGPLGAAQAIAIATQVCRGLATAHDLGIVHRDIKAANIIVGRDGHVSILDFGLALVPGAERLTQPGNAAGTLACMSPEQCQGKPLDHRTDVWAAGVLLFEMLTGSPPFVRESYAATLKATLEEAVPALAPARPDVPVQLEEIIGKCLAKDPSRRTSSMRELEASLLQVASTNTAGWQTQTIQTAAAGPARGGFRGRVAGAALGLTALAAIGFAVYQRSSVPRPAALSAPAESSRLVAVLPFEVSGSGTDTAELANGLSEILATALSELERADPTIAAIPSSEIRRRNITTAAESHRVYGASLAVAGTAQPAGANTRFALTLLDTVQARQLGSRTFDYDPGNPIASRERAVSELAALLSIKTAVPATALGHETAAPEASAAYLKGRGFLARYDVSGNLDRAIAQFTQAVNADPNYALAHSALAEALWRKSRATADSRLAAQALEHAERAVKIEPSLPSARTRLAAIYTTAARPGDAIRELKEALALSPGSAEVSRELARVYSAEGRHAEAETAYRQAIAARPTDWYGYLLLGLLYNDTLEYDKAIATFRQARDLTPGNELVYRNLAIAYLGKGQYQQAIAEFQQSLKIKPSAPTYASLGAAYYLAQRYADALAAVETAIDLDPQRYYFWGNLGIYCKWNPGSEGRARPALEKAVELARRLLELTPNDFEIRADLGEYYARLGDKSAALAEIGRIPDSARPSRVGRIAIVYELTGNRAKAVALLLSSKNVPNIWNEIRDDPDLAGLRSDPAIRGHIAQR